MHAHVHVYCMHMVPLGVNAPATHACACAYFMHMHVHVLRRYALCREYDLDYVHTPLTQVSVHPAPCAMYSAPRVPCAVCYV